MHYKTGWDCIIAAEKLHVKELAGVITWETGLVTIINADKTAVTIECAKLALT